MPGSCENAAHEQRLSGRVPGRRAASRAAPVRRGGPHGAARELRLQPGDGGHQQAAAATRRGRRRGGRPARQEHNGLAAALESEGVNVCVVEDTPEPAKPDAVFPNNWVSFHEDGTVVLYPMQAESRRRERRQEVVDAVTERLGFTVTRTSI